MIWYDIAWYSIRIDCRIRCEKKQTGIEQRHGMIVQEAINDLQIYNRPGYTTRVGTDLVAAQLPPSCEWSFVCFSTVWQRKQLKQWFQCMFVAIGYFPWNLVATDSGTEAPTCHVSLVFCVLSLTTTTFLQYAHFGQELSSGGLRGAHVPLPQLTTIDTEDRHPLFSCMNSGQKS